MTLIRPLNKGQGFIVLHFGTNRFIIHDFYRARQKSNPLGKIWYLWNCSKFFLKINSAHRGGFRPHIVQIFANIVAIVVCVTEL